MADATRFEPGDRFGDMRILAVLGRGAFGCVYLAEDTLIGRRVALKVVPAPGGVENAEQRGRALREARAVGRLNSPHIVTLYRVHPPGERDAWIFEMEYVEGGTLKDLLGNDARLPPRRAVEVVRDIATALRLAHEEGVVHGDVKPGNVLLQRDGLVKMADFGLARIRGDLSVSVSNTGGNLVGTPTFMAPEVVMGEHPTAASDIWSLGVILYRLLAGRLPFQATNLNILFYEIQNASPPPLDDAVPLPLAELAMHCLAKAPAERPHSCAAILSRLEESWAGRITAPAAPPPLVTPRARLVGREREVARLVTLVNRTERGQGAVALLTGEPGMGKSAVARNAVAIAKARGFHAIEASVSSLEGLLRPLVEVSRSMMRADEPSAPDSVLFGSAATVVHKLLAEEDGPRLEGRAQTVWALEQLLKGFAKTRRLALLVEDAQNADAEDLRLLKHLVRYLPEAGILLLITCQPRATDHDDEASHVHELAAMQGVAVVDLPSLSREAAYRLLEDRAGGLRIEPEVADRVLSVSQGNPLFLVELLRHLEETGGVVREAGAMRPGPTWKTQTLPRRFHELAARRLEGLSEEDRTLLDVAAADGLTFDGEAIAAVTEQPLLLVLRSLQRIYRERGLILPSASGYRFGNAVFHRVIYEDLAPELRSHLHLRLAEHLERRPMAAGAARVGTHWEAAGRWDRAVPYLLRASLEAYDRTEFLRAVDLGRRAGLPPPPSERHRLVEHAETVFGMAHSYENTSRYPEAVALLESLIEAAKEASDQELRLRAAVRLAQVRYATEGRSAVHEEELTRAASVLPSCAELGRARYLLGVVAKNRCALGEAESWLRSANEVFLELGLRSNQGSTAHQRAAVKLRAGRLREAAALFADAARISLHAGHRANAAASNVNRALIAFDLGELDGIETSLRESIRTLEIEGVTNIAAHASVGLGQILYALGSREAAERTLADAVRVLKAIGYLPGLPFALMEWGHLHAVRGDLDIARGLLAEARDAARKHDVLGLPSTDALETLVLAWAGEIEAATRMAERCLRAARDQEATVERHYWVLVLAEGVLYGLPAAILDECDALCDRDPSSDGPAPLVCTILGGIRAYQDPGGTAGRLHEGAAALHRPALGRRRAVMRILGHVLAAEGHRRTGDADGRDREMGAACDGARALGHVWLVKLLAGER